MTLVFRRESAYSGADMSALLLAILAGAALLTAYLTYGRWLAKRVFQLREDAPTPAVSLRDDRDYCPTKRSIVFGHHFTSIAGTGPIVGPAIAVMWGWVPAALWVIIGAIFIGAVHDLGSLVVSMRSRGRTIGDIAGDLLGPRVRLIFMLVLVMALWVVLAIFGLVIASVLRDYPNAIFPVFVQIPLAIVIGLTVHRKGGSILPASLFALAIMYASVIWGDVGWLHDFNLALAAQPLWVWVIGLLAYAYVASVIPVWVLLQPRDYINALQLLTALALLVLGLVVAGTIGGFEATTASATEAAERTRVPLEIVAPAVDLHPTGAPPMVPILFITIACGAISGFHCLVASGTTSKQLEAEPEARPVAYGGMLTEGFLAILVIIACAAGLGLGITKALEYRGTWTSPENDTYAFSEIPIQTGGERYHVVAMMKNPRWSLYPVTPPPGETVDGELSAAVMRLPEGMRASFATYYDSPAIVADNPKLPADDPRGMKTDPIVYGEGAERTPIGEGAIAFDRESATYTLVGRPAFDKQYESWSAAGSLAAMVGAFVDGASNLIHSLGLPLKMGMALMGVLVASFAGTTMDTACRLQRYVIQELSRTFLPPCAEHECRHCGYDLSGLDTGLDAGMVSCPECGRIAPPVEGSHDLRVQRAKASMWNPFKGLATIHGATLFAVITAALLAAVPPPGSSLTLANAGKGGLILWPLFGATNQLLAGLAFLVIAAWLIARRKPWWFITVPTVIMVILPAWALTWQAFIGDAENPSWLADQKWLLVAIAGATLILEAWLVIEVIHRMLRGGGPGEPIESSNGDTRASDDGPEACPAC